MTERFIAPSKYMMALFFGRGDGPCTLRRIEEGQRPFLTFHPEGNAAQCGPL
jgi:hypothetical protein